MKYHVRARRSLAWMGWAVIVLLALHDVGCVAMTVSTRTLGARSEQAYPAQRAPLPPEDGGGGIDSMSEDLGEGEIVVSTRSLLDDDEETNEKGDSGEDAADDDEDTEKRTKRAVARDKFMGFTKLMKIIFSYDHAATTRAMTSEPRNLQERFLQILLLPRARQSALIGAAGMWIAVFTMQQLCNGSLTVSAPNGCRDDLGAMKGLMIILGVLLTAIIAVLFESLFILYFKMDPAGCRRSLFGVCTADDLFADWQVSYVTDLQGNVPALMRWNQQDPNIEVKVERFCHRKISFDFTNQHALFVYGGNVGDVGSVNEAEGLKQGCFQSASESVKGSRIGGDIRITRALLKFKRQYPTRVFLLAGKRDVLKLSLLSKVSSLLGKPSKNTEISSNETVDEVDEDDDDGDPLKPRGRPGQQKAAIENLRAMQIAAMAEDEGDYMESDEFIDQDQENAATDKSRENPNGELDPKTNSKGLKTDVENPNGADEDSDNTVGPRDERSPEDEADRLSGGGDGTDEGSKTGDDNGPGAAEDDPSRKPAVDSKKQEAKGSTETGTDENAQQRGGEVGGKQEADASTEDGTQQDEGITEVANSGDENQDIDNTEAGSENEADSGKEAGSASTAPTTDDNAEEADSGKQDEGITEVANSGDENQDIGNAEAGSENKADSGKEAGSAPTAPTALTTDDNAEEADSRKEAGSTPTGEGDLGTAGKENDAESFLSLEVKEDGNRIDYLKYKAHDIWLSAKRNTRNAVAGKKVGDQQKLREAKQQKEITVEELQELDWFDFKDKVTCSLARTKIWPETKSPPINAENCEKIKAVKYVLMNDFDMPYAFEGRRRELELVLGRPVSDNAVANSMLAGVDPGKDNEYMRFALKYLTKSLAIVKINNAVFAPSGINEKMLELGDTWVEQINEDFRELTVQFANRNLLGKAGRSRLSIRKAVLVDLFSYLEDNPSRSVIKGGSPIVYQPPQQNMELVRPSVVMNDILARDNVNRVISGGRPSGSLPSIVDGVAGGVIAIGGNYMACTGKVCDVNDGMTHGAASAIIVKQNSVRIRGVLPNTYGGGDGNQLLFTQGSSYDTEIFSTDGSGGNVDGAASTLENEYVGKSYFDDEKNLWYITASVKPLTGGPNRMLAVHSGLSMNHLDVREDVEKGGVQKNPSFRVWYQVPTGTQLSLSG